MSVLSGTIIVKKKGFEVPLDFLKLAMSNNDSCSGFAMIGKMKEGDEQEKLIGQSLIGKPDLTKVQIIQTKFKDKNLIMYFGKNPTAMQKSVVPPYPVLTDENGSPILLAFLDGDCSQFQQKDSANPDIFFAVEKDLKPRLQDWFADADNDLDKLMEKITKSSTKRADLEKLFLGQGALCLFTVNDDVKFFHSEKKNTYQDFDWGAASNTYGWTSKKVEAKSSSEDKSSSPFSVLEDEDGLDDRVPTSVPSKSGDGGNDQPSQPEPQREEPNNPEPNVVPQQTPSVTPAASGTVKMFCPVPKDWAKMSASNRKGWLTQKGYPGKRGKDRPVGWNTPAFEGVHDYIAKDKVSTFQSRGFVIVDRMEGAVSAVADKSPKAVQGPGLPNRVVKDTAPKHIPSAAAKPAETPDAKPSEAPATEQPKVGDGYKEFESDKEAHLLPPDQREAIDKWLKSSAYSKFTGHNSEKLAADPRSLRDAGGKVPDFCAQVGVDLDDTLRWPADMLIDLGEGFGYTSLALLTVAYRNAYLDAIASKGGKEAPSGEHVTKEPVKMQAGWRR